MLPKWKLALIALLAAAGAGIALWYSVGRYREDKTVTARLETITKDYRQILILMDGAHRSGSECDRAAAQRAARVYDFDRPGRQVLSGLEI
ncbi:MAG TPA: hypothetical protein VHC90_02915 [Bryobacteraceae bacterium]|nr:hypothetical protein [Bryobacteraceae bacterium]